MTLAGHSAGSISAAYWSYAYASDPIVSAFVEFSGQPGLLPLDDGSGWGHVANQTGCANSRDVEEELECMQSLPARELKSAMYDTNMPSFTDAVYGGRPVVDNVSVFTAEEYASRGLEGKFAKLPLLITHTTNEADAILHFSPLTGVNTTLSELFTLSSFHCPVAVAVNLSASHGVPT
ncbi:hypothetical protein G7Y89_g10368 [Cudoniella acicularis]|uniref:Carboxylesterase type B domain-containing protein n=1 Tax=Cudoniella acicularis TaxID=354080 RepID=A0A8H4RCX7_9HELO|nr:hypothetical protein G7Y89_g10368 [Cudoniella acicularis]